MNNIKEHPILFSGPMVRAINEGRKTQTRRVVKAAVNKIHYRGNPIKLLADWPLSGIDSYNPVNATAAFNFQTEVDDFETEIIKCPYGHPGDRLWVRETWAWYDDKDGIYEPSYWYRADNGYNVPSDFPKWRPSIHMPRSASRILLEITDIRVERLLEISEYDAVAEGVEISTWLDTHTERNRPAYENYLPFGYRSFMTAQESFASLWQSIHGADSWNKNPFVWVIEFKKI